MENIKTYEGFLDVLKGSVNVVTGIVTKFLKRHHLFDGKYKIDLKNESPSNGGCDKMIWTWVQEIGNLGQFDFKLKLSESLYKSTGVDYRFIINCQSISNSELKSEDVGIDHSFRKLTNFFSSNLISLEDQITGELGKMIKRVSCDIETQVFIEDFQISDVEDYLFDLKDLVSELEVKLDRGHIIYPGASRKYNHIKGYATEGPSYIVTVNGLNKENIQDVYKELEVIESNIKNLGLKINDFEDVLNNINKAKSMFNEMDDSQKSFKFRLELVRK